MSWIALLMALALTVGLGTWGQAALKQDVRLSSSNISVSINDVMVSEGSSGTTSAIFTVNLSETSTETVTVNYATADGTATASSDYAAINGTLAIPAGQTRGTITVSVMGDNTSEASETFTLNLSSPMNASLSDAQGIGTIVNDDSVYNVWAWGSNGYGELGANLMTRYIPVPIRLLDFRDVTTIAGGYLDSLALKSDGTVWAWGYSSSVVPTQIKDASGFPFSSVTAIAAGSSHSLALKSDGTVWAWGYNGNGQLGNNSTSESPVPVQVSGLSSVIAIAAGEGHSLALKSDGTIWAWGYNGNGQLGNNSTSESHVPVQVNNLSGITTIAAGAYHSLALKSDGTVWAWGYNAYGQLGNINTTESESHVPVRVSGLSSVTAVVAGWTHSLALKSDGTVWAWGGNYYGQLGNNNTSEGQSSVPVQVSGLSGITTIAAGAFHSLALKSDGMVWAWGYNSEGQLGNNSTSESTVPVQVSGLSSVTAIAAGGYHSLVLSSQTSASPFATDDMATTVKNAPTVIQVLANDVDGDGDPLIVTDVGPTTNGGTVKLDSDGAITYSPVAGYIGSDSFSYTIRDGQNHSASATVAITINDNGNAVAWGNNQSGQLGNNSTAESYVPVQVRNFINAIAVAAGNDCSLALKSDGTVWAWGNNQSGQLGNNNTSESHVPVRVSGLSSVIAIAAGGGYNLALKSNGTVWAWGYNGNGRLGNNSTSESHVPVRVSALDTVMAIAACEGHSLALKSNGTVWAWGDNYSGQLGNNNTSESHVPVRVSGLSSVIAIAAGSSHSLALKSDGTVWAWGYNANGELGNNNTSESHVPVQVKGGNGVVFDGVIAISGGQGHSLALKSDGTVWAWGSGGGGALGNNSTSSSLVPVRVNNLSGVTTIAAGAYDSLALKSDGTVWGWGWNAYGQLGNNSGTILVPTIVGGMGGIKAISAGAYHTLAIHGSWTGAGDADDGLLGPSGNWHINGNWASNSVPAANEVANIQLPGTYSVFLDANATAGSLQLGDNDPTLGKRSLDLSGRALTLSNGANIKASGSLTGSGTINGDVVCKGELDPEPVTVTTAGLRSTRNINTRDINQGGGIINVSFDLMLESSAQSHIDIQGTSFSQYDRVWSGRSLTLNGSVIVSFVNGFMPQAGQSFEIYKAATINGDFVQQQLPPLSNGVMLQWERKANYDGNSPNTISYVLSAKAGPPVITGFTPGRGQAGDSVTISGTNLSGATAVTFVGSGTSTADDQNAVLPVPGSNFTNSLIKVKVPTGAVTGRLRVTTAGGSTDTGALNLANFTVLHRIGGVVRASAGLALSGVALDCINSSGLVRHLTNNSNGSFSFQRLPAGTYTIKPVAGGATSSFNPLQQRVSLGSSDVSGVLFIGLAGTAISGRVTDSAGNGVSEVIVRRTNRSNTITVRSNTQGYYSFSNVATGVTHRITPILSGYSFNPQLIDVAMGSASVSNLHFVALQGAAISGRVTKSSTGGGLSGVTVRRLDSSGRVLETVLTNSNGYYGFSNVAVGSYRIRAMLSGWSFSPLARSVNVSSTGSGGSVDGMDFAGTNSTATPVAPTAPSLRRADLASNGCKQPG